MAPSLLPVPIQDADPDQMNDREIAQLGRLIDEVLTDPSDCVSGDAVLEEVTQRTHEWIEAHR